MFHTATDSFAKEQAVHSWKMSINTA